MFIFIISFLFSVVITQNVSVRVTCSGRNVSNACDSATIVSNVPLNRCFDYCHPCDSTKCTKSKVILVGQTLSFTYYGPFDPVCAIPAETSDVPCGVCKFIPAVGDCPFCLPASSILFCDGVCTSSPCPTPRVPTSTVAPIAPPTFPPSSVFFPTPPPTTRAPVSAPVVIDGRPEVLIVYDEIMKELNVPGEVPILGCDGLRTIEVYIFGFSA